MTRPAEKITLGAATATAITGAFAGNWEVVVTSLVIGVLPAAVTFVVNNGGIRGVAARLWRGYKA